MVGPRSQCHACRHLVPEFGRWHCAAFEGGIPTEVVDNTLDHRQPVDGDGGIRFEAKPGDEFPAYAFRRR
jgi:hypothetical protein